MKISTKLRSFTRKASVRAAVLAVAVIAAAPLFVTGSASAATLHGCPDNYVCFWTNANFSGNPVFFGNPSGCRSVDPYVNQISSLVNNTGHDITIRQGGNCTWNYWVFHPHTYASNLSGTGWNDTISSFSN